MNYDQAAVNYDYTNPSYNNSNQSSSFSSNSYSSVPNYDNLHGSAPNYGYGDVSKPREDAGLGRDYEMDGVYAYKGKRWHLMVLEEVGRGRVWMLLV